MSASVRVAVAAVMTGAIAASIALPAIFGSKGSRQIVGAPRSEGRETVRVHGLAASATERSHPTGRSFAHAQRRKAHLGAGASLVSAVTRVSAPKRRSTVSSRPATPRPHRPPRHTAPAPPPKASPAPAPPPAPAPQPKPAPPAPAAASAVEQPIQTRGLVSTPPPAPTPGPPPKPTPSPPPTHQPPPPPTHQPPPPPPPVTQPPPAPPPPPPPPGPPPSGPPAHGHDHDDNGDHGRHHDESHGRDDASGERHDHDSQRGK